MWQPTELGALFAEREFTLTAEAGDTHAVILRLGVPVQGPETADPWWCPVSIAGLGDDRVFPVGGQDALQALLLALQYVRVTLEARTAKRGGAIAWLGDPGELGLPDDPPTRLVDQIGRLARLLHELRTSLRRSTEDEHMASLLVRADALLAGWSFPLKPGT